jgi:hypothetical protein
MRRAFFSVIAAYHLREWGMALGVRLLELNSQLRHLPLFKLGDRHAAPALRTPNQRGIHQLQDRTFPKERTGGIEPAAFFPEEAFRQIGRPTEAPMSRRAVPLGRGHSTFLLI